mmetsp:Transcript_11059/g.44532  ORF Transcript_11059/g.44532 Transcript_11059/m.44532 type:complete len:297 (+) Transcript_11059:678-1568(+)
MLAVWTAGLPFSANKECPYISCLQRRSKVLSPTLCSPATQSVAPLRSEASCTVFFYRKLPLNRLHEQRVRNPCRTAKFFANEESTRRLPDSKRAAVDVGSEFLLSLVVASSTFALAANAYEGYEGLGVPNDQATPLENGFGLLFTAFCCWYFLKVVKKRAARAKDIRLSNTSSSEERKRRNDEDLVKARNLSAQQSFVGGITGLGISFLLFGFAQNIQADFDGRALPESYQVRQITVTVRTIVEGLAYLATFIYAANGVGLMALGLQKCIFFTMEETVDANALPPEREYMVKDDGD